MKIKFYLYPSYRVRYGSDKRPNDFKIKNYNIIRNKNNYNIISNKKDCNIISNEIDDELGVALTRTLIR
jgi:hypothetical protein